MVELLKGDIFESGCQTITNTVNCKGIMGKGLALDFKQRFPRMAYFYTQRCREKRVKVGEPYLWTESDPWILNFPTKDHWKDKSNVHWIRWGLEYLLAHYEEWGVTSLAVPALGCGLGNLSWCVVGPVIMGLLEKLTIPVKVYLPKYERLLACQVRRPLPTNLYKEVY